MPGRKTVCMFACYRDVIVLKSRGNQGSITLDGNGHFFSTLASAENRLSIKKHSKMLDGRRSRYKELRPTVQLSVSQLEE